MSIRVSAKTKEGVLSAVRSQVEQLYYQPARVKKLDEMTPQELREYVNRDEADLTTGARQKEIDAIVALVEAKLEDITLTEGVNQSIDLFIPNVGMHSEVLVRTERDGTDMKDWSMDGNTYISEGRTFNADGTPVDGMKDKDGNLIGPNQKIPPKDTKPNNLGRTDGLVHSDPKNPPLQDPNKVGPGPTGQTGLPVNRTPQTPAARAGNPTPPPVPAMGAGTDSRNAG